MKYRFFCDCLLINYRSLRRFINHPEAGYKTLADNAESLTLALGYVTVKYYESRVEFYLNHKREYERCMDERKDLKAELSRKFEDQEYGELTKPYTQARLHKLNAVGLAHKYAYERGFENDFLVKKFGLGTVDEEKRRKILDYVCEVLAKYGVQPEKVHQYADNPTTTGFTSAFQRLQNRTEKRSKARAKID